VTFARRGLDVAVLEQQTEALLYLLTAADTPVTTVAPLILSPSVVRTRL
jgi:hypothetical protein